MTGFSGPFTIVRTQVWVSGLHQELIDGSVDLNDQISGPQGWSVIESRSEMNPDDPIEAGAWADNEHHYLAVGVVDMVPTILSRTTFEAGEAIESTEGVNDWTSTYDSQYLVVSSGRDHVDSHAQRLVNSEFPFIWFCVQGNGIVSNIWNPRTVTLECWVRVLCDFGP
jgi:hypothetical protein